MHTFDEWQIDLHGHRAIYRTVGSGPPVVLIHGMINSSRHWERVALRLADRHTVIAPDLLGHGDSATPRGDYSLGAHAASIRDLLSAIGVDRASYSRERIFASHVCAIDSSACRRNNGTAAYVMVSGHCVPFSTPACMRYAAARATCAPGRVSVQASECVS